MPVPWLRLLDMALGVTNLATGSRLRAAEEREQREGVATGTRALGHLETRLAGVLVAALKEAFDRDTRRLELEREQMEAERQRAERAMRLELLRQAAEREIARLRLVAGVAAASWIGTLFFSPRLMGGAVGPRVALGCGWLLMLMALALALVGQGHVTEALREAADRPGGAGALRAGAAAALAPWLLVAGLAAVGLSVLIS